MPIPLIMHGATGRMGRNILALAAADPGVVLAGGVAIDATGTLRDLGLPSDAPLGPDLPVVPGAVVVDFSAPAAFPALVRHCSLHGMSLVSGTTGIGAEVLSRELTAAAKRIAVMWAPNMSVGVTVLLAAAAQLARGLGLEYDIEIVEAHHHHKTDAPSGTALAIADAVLSATGRTRADLVHGREGQVGARRRGEVGMHALRMGDVVGDHTVYFVGGGERITLGHVAHTREIFARGALRAAVAIGQRPPGRYAFVDLLGM